MSRSDVIREVMPWGCDLTRIRGPLKVEQNVFGGMARTMNIEKRRMML
jgi:hypothetical protein